MNLLWILVAAAVLLLVVRLLIVSYSNMLVKVFVDDRHEDADTILQTGMMPTRWLVTQGRVPRLKRPVSRRTALRRLRKIIAYFEQTRLVGTDEERAVKVSRLRAVYAAWENSSQAELIPPELERSSN